MIPKLYEIQHAIKNKKIESTKSLRVLVLQNFTFYSLENHIRYHMLNDSVSVDFVYGGFDTIFQDTLNSEFIIHNNPDVIIIASYFSMLSEMLCDKFASLNDKKIDEEFDRVVKFDSQVIENLRQHTNNPIILFNIPQPNFPAFGVFDSVFQEGQLAIFEKINAHLKNIVKEQYCVYLFDIDACIRTIGHENAYDLRYWSLSKMPFSYRLQHEIGLNIAKYMRIFSGKSKKCLVIDCDNVLWGGILGELGWQGIKIGKGSGEAYLKFQQAILNLYHRGVLLALCSKNNKKDVLECFEKNVHMLLKLEHFVCMKINWQDKATNIIEIASELNIGLDSMVFIDDSVFEIELVKTQVSDVTVLHANAISPEKNIQLILGHGYFDTMVLTSEDKMRPQLYQQEQSRKQLKFDMKSLDVYLKSLQMKLSIQALESSEVSRAVQLMQRTNQFNITTRMLDYGSINGLIDNPAYTLLLVSLTDKFGSYGYCGLVILHYYGEFDARLEVFLLSCRVLGRGVETALMCECKKIAKHKGCKQLEITYKFNKKNQQCEDFLKNFGFVKNEQNYCISTDKSYYDKDAFMLVDNKLLTFLEERC